MAGACHTRLSRAAGYEDGGRVQVHMRHTPSFGVARLGLAAGEAVRVESGAMLATSYGVAVDARPQGGLLTSLARAALGSDSVLVTIYTAPAQGGWVDVAPTLPGDLCTLPLNGTHGWCLTRGGWLASDVGVELATKWGGFRSLFGGDGGFLMHASGTGMIVMSCFGALDVLSLEPGEYVTVDTGHVVGYSDAVQSRLRPISQGTAQSMRSGEGLVFDFAGPGQVLTQTRNPRGFVAWLQSAKLGGG